MLIKICDGDPSEESKKEEDMHASTKQNLPAARVPRQNEGPPQRQNQALPKLHPG
jgi:hypothetical protein